VIEPLGFRPNIAIEEKAETKDYGTDYLDQIVNNSKAPLAVLDEKIQKQLSALKDSPGDIAKMIELQLEVGKRSLMISTTTGSLKTAKDDAATVARAI